MRIRRSSYQRYGQQPISLPFIEALADQHPEAVEAPAPASQEAERRGPRMRYGRRGNPEPLSPPKVKRERGPAMTQAYIRRVLNMPEPPDSEYEWIMRRVWREGA